MKRALIGYTGFVGNNLNQQTHFDYVYNSKNIQTASNEEYDLVVCAAPSAVKWKANQNPEEDLHHINALIDGIREIKTGTFIQISTVDVYKTPQMVYEDTPLDCDELHAYGRNRIYLESFIKKNFKSRLIIRLPALFGDGLKKNFIFDLLNDNRLDLTDRESEFQFYSLTHLWSDITLALQNSLTELNISTEPLKVQVVAKECCGVDFQNRTEQPPVKYDMRSRYDHLFQGHDGYLYDKKTVLSDLHAYVSRYRRR